MLFGSRYSTWNIVGLREYRRLQLSRAPKHNHGGTTERETSSKHRTHCNVRMGSRLALQRATPLFAAADLLKLTPTKSYHPFLRPDQREYEFEQRTKAKNEVDTNASARSFIRRDKLPPRASKE